MDIVSGAVEDICRIGVVICLVGERGGRDYEVAAALSLGL